MPVRLADLLAGLSRLGDLGFALPTGTALRACALATGLARSLGLSDADVRASLYTSLLHHVGCTGYAHETARLFGDELALNLASGRTDLADPRDMLRTFLPALTAGRRPADRARAAYATFRHGRAFGEAYTTAACEVGRDAARRLGLPDEVQRSVYHVYEMWQGGGLPAGLAGDDIPIAARIARAAGIAALFDSIGGAHLAADVVSRRADGMLDPAIATYLAHYAPKLLGELEAGDPLTLVLEAEPAPVVRVKGPELVDVATVFADLADLKSPYTHGHSRGVATLAKEAGADLGMPATTTAQLELSGLLHDLGRVAVSDAVWEKAGRLREHEWEQVRLHAYHSERIVAGSPRLSGLAPLVGSHHERVDASGYHRGCDGSQLSTQQRVLAAADAYQAMTQTRAHRSALDPDDAAQALRDDAGSGHLDADAVAAVLRVAGHDEAPPSRDAPAGLSEREIEVLALVAQGHTNAQVAEQLGITRRTAEHHVQHIYTKIGVSSRAAAALFAMEHRLLRGGHRATGTDR